MEADTAYVRSDNVDRVKFVTHIDHDIEIQVHSG